MKPAMCLKNAIAFLALMYPSLNVMDKAVALLKLSIRTSL